MAARSVGNLVAEAEACLACSVSAEILDRSAFKTPPAVPPGMDTQIPQACADWQSSRPSESHAIRGGTGKQVVGGRIECAERPYTHVGSDRCGNECFQGGADFQGGLKFPDTAGVSRATGVSMGRQLLGGRLLCGKRRDRPGRSYTALYQGTAKARTEHAEVLIPRAFSPGSGFIRFENLVDSMNYHAQAVISASCK